jgi:hypothetical protein
VVRAFTMKCALTGGLLGRFERRVSGYRRGMVRNGCFFSGEEFGLRGPVEQAKGPSQPSYCPKSPATV